MKMKNQSWLQVSIAEAVWSQTPQTTSTKKMKIKYCRMKKVQSRNTMEIVYPLSGNHNLFFLLCQLLKLKNLTNRTIYQLYLSIKRSLWSNLFCPVRSSRLKNLIFIKEKCREWTQLFHPILLKLFLSRRRKVLQRKTRLFSNRLFLANFQIK